ncbi:MAG: ZIP family metal transporter [Candidatus Omnitrophica bacterium]|nr:ZIP family metal transporter [Candidatus Omnitrophota bacterium]MDD5436907.1 ZIP family metal transporter [Candidatus Omnitrophota bacterium]
MNFIYALIASIIVSLISLIGIFALVIRDNLLRKVMIFLIAFAAGGLIGGAFFDLIPEAAEYVKDITELFVYVIVGYVLFFMLEKYLHWRHCHTPECKIHRFTYLNIIGDIVHNFGDGLIIGAVFLIDVKVGIATTLAIVFHEIPHEIGNFTVLVYGGFSKLRALFFNFVSALFAIVGTVVGFYFAGNISGFSRFVLPAAAGGFIYIASCDLIPELHKEEGGKRSALIMVTFVIGITLMYFLKMIE